MGKKQQLTVKNVISALESCSTDALIDIMLDVNGEIVHYPVTTLAIHENENKKELISFINESEREYDI